VIGCFGNLTSAKRIPQLVEAFARVREEFPNALLLLVGQPAPGFPLDSVLERHGVKDHVLQLDYVDEQTLWSLLAASDISVNLRWPTMGETSGTAIRALVLGKTLVVSDVGWFAELPDDAVEKISVDDHEVDALAETLRALSRDPARRERIGSAGERWVRSEHDLDRVADAYVAALEGAAGRRQMQAAVLGDVAQAAAEVGLGARDPGVKAAGEGLSEVGLGD
jgi:glycosyltransferase involved in cell wall biosynthesis